MAQALAAPLARWLFLSTRPQHRRASLQATQWVSRLGLQSAAVFAQMASASGNATVIENSCAILTVSASAGPGLHTVTRIGSCCVRANGSCASQRSPCLRWRQQLERHPPWSLRVQAWKWHSSSRVHARRHAWDESQPSSEAGEREGEDEVESKA